jgi:hypothetical protein
VEFSFHFATTILTIPILLIFSPAKGNHMIWFNLTPFDSNWTAERVVTPLFGSFGFVRFPSPAPDSKEVTRRAVWFYFPNRRSKARAHLLILSNYCCPFALPLDFPPTGVDLCLVSLESFARCPPHVQVAFTAHFVPEGTNHDKAILPASISFGVRARRMRPE